MNHGMELRSSTSASYDNKTPIFEPALVNSGKLLNTSCPICADAFEVPIATLDCCNHAFCLTCIEQWAETSTTCPLDRFVFKTVSVIRKIGEKPSRRLYFRYKRTLPNELVSGVDAFTCHICHNYESDVTLMVHCSRCCLPSHLSCIESSLNIAEQNDNWKCGPCSVPNGYWEVLL